MARVINQETFNEAVKENIEMFDMTEEEAVEETKKQFEAQGVNLKNIVMTCSSTAVVAQCVATIKRELMTSYPDRDKAVSNELSILKIELDKELSIRLFAGKEGLYPLLIDCLNKMDAQFLLQILETLTSLTNGYPDVVDKSGLDFMVAFLHTSTEPALIIQDLKWMKNSIIKHEKNRSDLIVMGVQDRFRNILRKFSDDAKLIVLVCQVVKKLVSDDDIRVVHGNPHDHARALAKETLCSFVNNLEKYQNNPVVLNDLLQVIYALIVRDEFCIKVYEQNGIRLVLDSMVKYPDDERINRQCLLLLKGLAGNDQIKEAIVGHGAPSLIMSCMYRHKTSASLISAGCMCLSALALRSPANAEALVESGAVELLSSILNLHKDNHVVLKHACMAIKNHASRSEKAKAEYLQSNVEEVLNEILGKDTDVDYEAKAVLRQLGCNVVLDEPWKGEGRQIPR